MTQFKFQKSPAAGTLAVAVFQQEKGLSWSPSAKRFPEALLRQAAEDGFRGAAGAVTALRPGGGKPHGRILAVSAGKAKDADAAVLRKTGAAAARWAMDAGVSEISFLLPDHFGAPSIEAQGFVEGFVLGAYRFQKHQSRSDKAKLPARVVLVGDKPQGVAEAMARGQAFAQAVNFARDLINEPPSMKVPETLAKAAQSLSGGGVKARVFHKTQLKAMRMAALLGVNRGSAHPPVLVHLHYKPSGKPKRRLALVGKGITFDSGGLSLKPADGMMTMKYDMAGAASVFAVFHALRALRPDVEVHGITPITENMPGQDAYKPGDVVRAANGKTIEVLNTDAEGRVVLADALSYASRLPVDQIVDIATLTGAASVALGKAYVALMSNDDSLCVKLDQAANQAGEKVWRLPLEKSYKEHIRSKVADLKNIGNPGEAGTIIGGLFLEEFVDNKPWAHLDMASVGWNGAGTLLSPPGATGAPIRTLLNFVFENE